MTEHGQAEPDEAAEAFHEKEQTAYRYLVVYAAIILFLFLALVFVRHAPDGVDLRGWISFLGTLLGGVGAFIGMIWSCSRREPMTSVVIWIFQVLGFWGAAIYAYPGYPA